MSHEPENDMSVIPLSAAAEIFGDDRYIPEAYEGKLEPNYYCRGWNGKEGREKYCGARAGAGTDHFGVGRCKHHSGNVPVKHGMRRRYELKTSRLGELIERHEADEDPLNILPELALLRSLAEDYIERYQEFSTALLAWHESYLKGENTNPKPRQILDLSSAGQLVAEITKAAERFLEMQSRNAITYSQLKTFVFATRVVIESRLREAITDPAEADKLLEKIWGELRAIRP